MEEIIFASLTSGNKYLKMYPYVRKFLLSFGIGVSILGSAEWYKIKSIKDLEQKMLLKCYEAGKLKEQCKKEIKDFVKFFQSDDSLEMKKKKSLNVRFFVP